MSKFKVGDKVVCIHGDEVSLKSGCDYVITDIETNSTSGDDYVMVNGIGSMWFWESRFKLIEQPSEVKYGLPLIEVKTVIDLLEDYEMEKEDIINYLNGYIDGARGGKQ